MVRLGLSLSSEEHEPRALVENARAAEDAGFDFVMVSDHFHPWTTRQGNAPFVWSVLGGIASVTERITVGTAVTCPLIRIHPAIVAQAAATSAAMMPGRFVLGLGTGEALNEHVTGERWPSATERRAMLEEAVEVIRELWGGELTDYSGRYYRVVDAQLFTLPDEPPPIVVAASGEMSAKLAGRIGNGFMGTSPDPGAIDAFRDGGGEGKPAYGQVTHCWGRDLRRSIETAIDWWPNAAIKGELGQELPLPRHFEQAAGMVDEADVAEAIACGPDPERHAEMIQAYVDAGYDHVLLHQVGPDQLGFIGFARDELFPRFSGAAMRRAG